MPLLRLVLNVIWLVLAGFWMAVGYAIAGAVACLLVVTLPFGVAALRLASYALWPFGRTVVADPTAGAPSAVANVLWLVLFGWWLALGHVVTGVALCLTIVGIPMGVASFKLVPLSLLPLGRRVVGLDETRRSGAIVVPDPAR